MENDSKYLSVLSELYPNIAATARAIINYQSILNLPKGTEHYISDIHGEFAAFSHVLRNGSGAVRKKIDDVFGHTLNNSEKRSLATLIYYPKEKIRIARESEEDLENWYYVTIYRLIKICKIVSSKYTRSSLKDVMPPEYEHIIGELITEKAEIVNKEAYYDAIVESIVEIEQAEEFIYALCEMIQKLVIARLHVLGDIFDRGPYPDKILDTLMDYHSLDIQWGNHDLEWMGAASGQAACVATVIRNSVRYANLDVIEDGYGINMMPLAQFALDTYKDDPCARFKISKSGKNISEKEEYVLERIHKAIAIIQFKLEGQLIKKRPEYELDDRLLLDKINWETKTIIIEGREYPLADSSLPTVDPADPYKLNEEEAMVMKRIVNNFKNSEKLQRHIHFLLTKGSIYKVYNHNLLYHGCVPLNEDGSFRKVNIYGKEYSGKALYDILEVYVRKAFFATDKEEREKGRDIMWWLWLAPGSPVFGKAKMATFEGYFVDDKALKKEPKNSYYTMLEKPKIAIQILEEFGCNKEDSHIINGHVPVHQIEGENPIKCNGKVIVIDGGFSKPYQKVTGIAGYTLIYNSYGMTLAAHEPFVTTEKAITTEADVISHRQVVYQTTDRRLVRDTDKGKEILEKVDGLKMLLAAYRSGEIKERF